MNTYKYLWIICFLRYYHLLYKWLPKFDDWTERWKIVENGYSFVGAKKIECNGHQFYLMQTRSPIYIHAYDCGCGEVSSVDSTLCKLYGIVK